MARKRHNRQSKVIPGVSLLVLFCACSASPQPQTRAVETSTCPVGKFWSGYSCLPCSECSPGTYSVTRCTDFQDNVCADCLGKPSNASWVTSAKHSDASCTWLCDADFNEIAGECSPCKQCTTGFDSACGYGATKRVPSNSSITRNGSPCYATCGTHDLFFTGVWSTDPQGPVCECAYRQPPWNSSHADSCEQLSQKQESCPAGEQSIASFTTQEGLILVAAREVAVSRGEYLFSEMDKDGAGNISFDEVMGYLLALDLRLHQIYGAHGNYHRKEEIMVADVLVPNPAVAADVATAVLAPPGRTGHASQDRAPGAPPSHVRYRSPNRALVAPPPCRTVGAEQVFHALPVRTSHA